MPKKETQHIQEEIRKLGEKLGFISETEVRLHEKENYAPVYDAIWFLDLEKRHNLAGIGKLFRDAPELFRRIKRLPFVGFEIEGAATTSKNQLGNFANLYSGNFLYNFVVVNNSGASGENDTYRRGIKLKRYFSEHSGDNNVFMLDQCHLVRSIKKLSNFDHKTSKVQDSSNKRKSAGGETDASGQMREKILRILKGSGLSIHQDYEPWLSKVKYEMAKEACGDDGEWFRYFYTGQAFMKDPLDKKPTRAKKVAESIYVPKLDICAGFTAPTGFSAWLATLADEIGEEGVAHFPMLYALQRKLQCVCNLFVPLIGIEIETSLNKHLSGGIFNLAKNTYAGIVIANDPAVQKVVDFYKKELGIKSVTTYCVEE